MERNTLEEIGRVKPCVDVCLNEGVMVRMNTLFIS